MESSGVYEPGHGGFGAGVALGVHLLAGFGWIFVLANLAGATVGDTAAGAWGASAFILWLRAADSCVASPPAMPGAPRSSGGCRRSSRPSRSLWSRSEPSRGRRTSR